jgi:hypothetical protein
MTRHATRARAVHRIRPAVVIGALLTAATVAAIASVGVTSASFTDQAASALGTNGSVGGSYDIAQLAPDDSVVQGDPDALILDTSNAATVALDATTTATVETRVVTTTAATGPVHLSLYNAFQGTRPSDPGFPGPGIDPYAVALYTVSVDGTALSTAQTAADVNAAAIVIDGWTANVPKTITVTTQLPMAVGNAYVFNRSLVLGLRFDGATS